MKESKEQKTLFFFWVKRNRELSVISNMSLVNKKYFTIYLFYFYFLKIFMRNYLPFLKGYKSISTYFSSSFLFKPNKGKIICSKKKKNSILSLLSLTKNTKRKPPSNVPKNPKIDNYSVSFFFFF